MNILPILTPQQFARFLAKINVRSENECWPWLASKKFNYGAYTIQFKGEYTHYPAHRLAYRNLVGPFDEALHILHSCDNPACCNPKHLYPGTLSQNAKDMVARGRAPTLFKPGHKVRHPTPNAPGVIKKQRKRIKPWVKT